MAAQTQPHLASQSYSPEDAGDTSTSDEEAAASSQSRSQGTVDRIGQQAGEQGARRATTTRTGSDKPEPLEPQTGAEFAAEAKQRKLDKKRRLDTQAIQPKPLPPLRESSIRPRGDANAAGDGEVDDEEAREHTGGAG